MSRKLQIMLPDPVSAQLHELAAGAGKPPATLARKIVRGIGRVEFGSPCRFAETR